MVKDIWKDILFLSEDDWICSKNNWRNIRQKVWLPHLKLRANQKLCDSVKRQVLHGYLSQDEKTEKIPEVEQQPPQQQNVNRFTEFLFSIGRMFMIYYAVRYFTGEILNFFNSSGNDKPRLITISIRFWEPACQCFRATLYVSTFHTQIDAFTRCWQLANRLVTWLDSLWILSVHDH